MTERDEMATRNMLVRDRGWTDKLIRVFAGKPDDTRTNIHYKSGPPVKLYRLARIIEIERGEPFRKALAAATARKQSATAAAAAKRAATRAWVAALPAPHLPVRTEEELTDLAVRAYNARGGFGDRPWSPADRNSDQGFLDRIAVNFVRHELTGYEEEMARACGRVGAADARHAIRTRVLDAIGEAYVWLGAACDRQQERYDEEYFGDYR